MTSRMSPESPAYEIARRLIERHLAREGVADAAAAARAAGEDVCRDLARWVGPDGCRALMTRALALAAHKHAVLSGIRVSADSAPRLEGIDRAAESTDTEPIAVALQTMLIELIELLTRFIGEDMVVNLIDRTDHAGPEDGTLEAGS